MKRIVFRLGLPLARIEGLTSSGGGGEQARYLSELRRLLAKTQKGDRKLPLYMAREMTGTKSRRREASN